MNKSSKIIAIILGILIIIAIGVLVINSGRKNINNSRNIKASQNISNITYEEVDEKKLSTSAKEKIEKIKGRRGNFVLEYGDETVIMLSQGMKTAQLSDIEVVQISKNNENEQYTISIMTNGVESNEIGVGNERERYLYKIIKVDAKFDDKTVGYVTDNMGSIIRIIDAERVMQNTNKR